MRLFFVTIFLSLNCHAFDNELARFADAKPARTFTSNEIMRLASSPNLKLRKGRLIIDNDAAFDSKVEMIRSAQREIRMMYFLYADDDSSSVISHELIEKAKAGVKVKLLVDFISNYK